jgi:hypothetical protein
VRFTEADADDPASRDPRGTVSGSEETSPDDDVTSDDSRLDFEEAQEIDETTGTIACPACGTGRVGFDVF